MRIGELAKQSGMAAHTIRFYEQEGLLPKAERNVNGYRVYNAESLKRLAGIQCAKHLGFSLEDIRLVFAEQSAEHQIDKERVLQQLDARLHEVDTLMLRLKKQKQEIQQLKTELEEVWAQGQCMDAERLQTLQKKDH